MTRTYPRERRQRGKSGLSSPLRGKPDYHVDRYGLTRLTQSGRAGGGLCRAGTARTYLHPALKRPNLQLVTKRLVYRVLFDGKRAVGVEFARASMMPAVTADDHDRREGRGDDTRRRVAKNGGVAPSGAPNRKRLSSKRKLRCSRAGVRLLLTQLYKLFMQSSHALPIAPPGARACG